ncbi:unnamed protein product [Rotaria socialis]|uniref:Uncharacterized protein n=1 Tax=Rotaria socialis TaxID=392032 RepID=A0A818MIS9_9BILA|nr:unnamed protein product [Rotaria socialis]CAF3761152.1 unnamed protein product [Rotaria socialis]CAF4457575.1 unnamed protein product [Rotaria socialis]CAF4613758.1 unnamed protein product [Rotaria socialis]
MTKVELEEHSLPYICPSAVNFHSDVDENEFKSKSLWNPDWTIQREISITIDKSLNNVPKMFSKKIQIIIAIVIVIGLILSIVLPLIILIIDPHWLPTIQNQSK